MSNPFSLSTLQKIMHVALSGMMAQKERFLVVSQNLANVGSRASQAGTDPYARKTISFVSEMDRKKGVEVVKVKKVDKDSSPFPLVHAPHDPAANADGFVAETNVKGLVEMTDAMESKRAYEANLKSYEKALSMQQDAIGLLKNSSHG